jgi:hypothetical protein
MFVRSRWGGHSSVLGNPDGDHLARTWITHPLYLAAQLDAIVAPLLESLRQKTQERIQHATGAMDTLRDRRFFITQIVIDRPTTESELPGDAQNGHPLLPQSANLTMPLRPAILASALDSLLGGRTMGRRTRSAGWLGSRCGNLDALEVTAVAGNDPFNCFSQVCQKVETIRNLEGFRRTFHNAFGILEGAVPTDNLNVGMSHEPIGQRTRPAIW